MCIFKEVAPTAYEGTPRRADTEDAYLQAKRKAATMWRLFMLLNRLYSRRAIRSFRLSRILNPLTTTLTGEVRERPEEVNLPEQALPEMPERESGSL